MSAINFNWFYHNNCSEFQDIKNRIWEFNNFTPRQRLVMDIKELRDAYEDGVRCGCLYLSPNIPDREEDWVRSGRPPSFIRWVTDMMFSGEYNELFVECKSPPCDDCVLLDWSDSESEDQ